MSSISAELQTRRGDSPAAEFRGVALDSHRSWRILILLMLSYALSFVDRQLLNLLVDPVKRSLILTDTQISLLQGTAFVSAYCIAAPFFGRMVDITNRRNVLIAGVIGWSVATMMCAFADTFWELAIARFGVGLFEASVFPVAWSLIPDLFTARRSTRAYSIFMLGSQLGSAVALLAGGLMVATASQATGLFPFLAGLETWQACFLMVGLPGFLVAALLLTFREPKRTASEVHKEHSTFTLSRSLSVLSANRCFYTYIFLGVGTMSLVNLSVPAWFPSFLVRVHGQALQQVGLLFGSALLGGGVLGLLIGPMLGRWLEQRGYLDAPLRVSIAAGAGMLVCSFALPLAATALGAILIAGCIIFFSNISVPLLGSACQRATPGQMRGLVSSIYTLSVQTIGYAGGPTLVALCTDRLFEDPLMVGHSLQIVCSAASAVMVLVVWLACAPFRRMMASESGAPR